MPVYMVRAGEHGPVKIGFSDNVALRLVKMQTDNHERLTILRIFEGGPTEEELLHERFADQHLHGDWHSFTDAMLGDVGLSEEIQWGSERAVAAYCRFAGTTVAQYKQLVRDIHATADRWEAHSAARGTA